MRQIPRFVSAAALVAAILGDPDRAAAQTPHKSPIVEGSFGYAGFVDALAFGGSVRKRITPRVSIGPEFLVFHGRPVDRFVTFDPGPYLYPDYSTDGDVVFDPGPHRYRYQESFGAAAIMVTAAFDLTSRPFSGRRVVPYVIASGGLLIVGSKATVGANSFGGLPISGVVPAISGGVGVRIDLGRLKLGPEIRIGPESPLRVGVVFGIR